MRILLDLDCTLAHFVGGVARLHGLTAADLLRHWPAGDYGIAGPLGRAIAEQSRTGLTEFWRDQPVKPWTRDGREMSAAEFWAPINREPGFWAALDPLPWADELFRLCVEAAGGACVLDREGSPAGVFPPRIHTIPGDLYVVTSPSRCPGCVREKEDWLLRHFGLPPDRMIPTAHKFLLAGPGTVLVDDYGKNCDDFRRPPDGHPGGDAVLLPCHHNEDHRFVGRELEVVRARLDRLRSR